MLFQRFRRPQWQHANPTVRRQAVTRLSAVNEDDSEILQRLAVEDAESSVRVAAVKRLMDPVLLRTRMAEDDHAMVREAARARYGRLLAGGCEGWDLTARLAELNGCDDPLVLAQVARRGRDEAMRAAALARLDDDNVLEEAALHDSVARVRQLAVEQIKGVGPLSRLAAAGGVGDRRIARLARQRLEAVREKERLLGTQRAEAERLCDELDALAGAPAPDPTAAARGQRLRNRWTMLGEAPTPEQAARFRTAVAGLEKRLAETLRQPEEPPPAAPSLADALAGLDTRQEPDFEAIEAVARALATDAAADVATRDTAEHRLGALRRYLARQEALTAAADADALAALTTEIDWPEDLAAPPVLRQARKRTAPRQPETPEPAQSLARRADALEDFTARLSGLEADLDAGRLRAAKRDLQRTRRAADGVPGGLPAGLERRLARAAARVAEWRDWRRFAVQPKQEALCEAMEALAGDAGLAPPERVERVRALQRQWRATGGSDSSRSRELWQRFIQAAEQAFESCRGYLDAEAERRRRNLAERGRIADQLEHFLAQPDWMQTATGQLDRIRRTARREWQAAMPVERAEEAALGRRFEASMDRLTEKIDVNRDAAGERKERLIADAERLTAEADTERAAAEAKALQQAWKAAGSARPARERALWRRFRAVCDVIFERRDEYRREASGQEAAVVADGEIICERLEALTALDEPDAVRRGLDDLAERFQALRLPAAGRQGTRSRYDRAERAARRHLDALLASRERNEIDQLLATTRAGEASAAVAMEEERLREIVVRLEILASLDSPACDEPLRLSQQVERLHQGMAEGMRETSRAEARRLLTEWADSAGNPPELTARVRQAIDVLFPIGGLPAGDSRDSM